MISAVGAIFMSEDTGRIMLNQRSEHVPYGNYWGFIGGKILEHELPVEALIREIHEEIGYNIPKLNDIIPFDVYITKDKKFRYYSFVIFVSHEFIPELNNESDGYCWVKIGKFPKPLHPGAKNTLYNEHLLQDFESLWESKKNGKPFFNSLPKYE